MKTYELMVIVNPNLSDADFTKAFDQMRKNIEKSKGSIVNTNDWGNRKLAYPIKKHTHGRYLLHNLSMLAKDIEELKKYLKMDDRILRFLLINAPKQKEEKTNPEQSKKQQGDSSVNTIIK